MFKGRMSWIPPIFRSWVEKDRPDGTVWSTHQLGKVKAQLRERAELDEDQLGCPLEVRINGQKMGYNLPINEIY